MEKNSLIVNIKQKHSGLNKLQISAVHGKRSGSMVKKKKKEKENPKENIVLQINHKMATVGCKRKVLISVFVKRPGQRYREISKYHHNSQEDTTGKKIITSSGTSLKYK